MCQYSRRVGLRFGAAEFLDSCLRGVIALVACIWCRWLFGFGQMSLTLPGSGLVGWCLESVFFADTNTAIIFIPPNVNLGTD